MLYACALPKRTRNAADVGYEVQPLIYMFIAVQIRWRILRVSANLGSVNCTIDFLVDMTDPRNLGSIRS